MASHVGNQIPLDDPDTSISGRSDASADLGIRQRAEALALEIGEPDLSSLTSEEIARLFQELRIHGIELELQNEALQQSRAMLTDITQHRQATEDLRESDRRLQLALTSSGISFWEWFPQTGEISFDSRWPEILGYGPGEWKFDFGWWDSSLHPDSRPVFEQAMHDYTEGRAPRYELEYQIKTNSGEWKWVWAAGECVEYTSAGEPQRFLGTHIDVTDRKRAEVALRASEEGFRRQFESTPVPTFIWKYENQQFMLININIAADRLAQGKASQFLGWSVEQIYPDRPDLIERFHSCLNENKTIVYETDYRARGTGLDRVIIFTFVYIGPDLVMLHTQDITERVKVEEALSESEKLFRTIAANLPNSYVSIIEKDLTIGLTAGKELTRQNLDPAQYVGLTLEEVFGKHASIVRKYYVETFAGQETAFELTIYDQHQLYRTVPLPDESGEISRILVVVENVTEQKQAEAALGESEQQYRQLFEMESDAIFLIDNEAGQIIEANRAAAALYGYSHEELLAKKNSDLSAEPEETQRVTHGMPVITDNLVTIPLRWHRKKCGDVFPVEITGRFFERKGRSVHIAAIRDITGRKRAEAEGEDLRARLVQAQKLETVGQLAGGVAHDFNNMLAVILMRTVLAQQLVEPGTLMSRHLAEIDRTAQRSAELVKQLLGFARKQTVAPKVLDLNKTVEETLVMLHRMIGEEIELNWCPGVHLWPVEVDPSQIDQILTNLCVNARDAIDGIGTITITTANVEIESTPDGIQGETEAGDYVMISVSDDGSGIDTEILEHLFEPFFTTKEIGKGTGLGLATVYGIVKQNRGQIKVSSELNSGTIFEIYLPRFAEDVAEPSFTLSDEVPQGHGESVLLVEDEADLLQLGLETLEMLGYTVLAANDPREAKKLAETHTEPIDLLVTDVIMPKMDGRQLAEQIAAFHPQIKCLYISGYPANIIAHRGILDEGVVFLQKPFSLLSFATKVGEALATRTVPQQPAGSGPSSMPDRDQPGARPPAQRGTPG